MAKAKDEPDPDVPAFASAGTPASAIDVKISYRIIQLFSEGLYSSPNKAIEELVSNSFDAGAENVHVLVSADLEAEDSTIVVIDDGEGMDESGLKSHWIIGESGKRKKGKTLPKGRKQIGKFGIGKLATYVLANRLSHVTKVGGRFYATSMDYKAIPSDKSTGAGTLDETVMISMRMLTSAQAKEILEPWITGDKPGFAALKLFGKDSRPSWTVAIMSELKDMVKEISPGRLKWVLSTAMPLRNDFNLFLNGEKVESSKNKGKTIGHWQLGKSLKKPPKPAPDDFEVEEDLRQPEDSVHRIGITHPTLGRITGTMDLYVDLLTSGKAADWGRSHGFFVYTRGRLVNADDPYLGISSNKLRHGTLSRLRVEVHIDRLDKELRSSRESVLETGLIKSTRSFLEGLFAVARKKHEEYDEEEASGRRATQRVAETAPNLARTPLKRLISKTLDGSATPMNVRCPDDLTEDQKEELIESIEKKSATPEGLISQIVQAPLGQNAGIASYDPATGVLEINSLHPFVAYFGDEFSDKNLNLPLELLATSEVLLEASMYEMGIKESLIHDVMEKRDILLRELARSTGRRNALLISQDVQNSSSDQNLLQQEVVAALDVIGFNAVPVGGAGKRDALAQTHLGARKGARPYSVSIEVMAKTKPDKKVTATLVGVSKIAKHRDEEKVPCDHALVVLVDFPKDAGELATLKKQLKEDADENNKTITFITVDDFARLTRLAPARRVGLPRLRDLFQSCTFPAESKAWVDAIAESKPSDAPYQEILEAIFQEQQDLPGEVVEYSQIETRLRIGKSIVIGKQEIIDICQALHRIVPEYVYAGQSSVEVMNRPDRILEALKATIKQYPEDKRPARKKPNGSR